MPSQNAGAGPAAPGSDFSWVSAWAATLSPASLFALGMVVVLIPGGGALLALGAAVVVRLVLAAVMRQDAGASEALLALPIAGAAALLVAVADAFLLGTAVARLAPALSPLPGAAAALLLAWRWLPGAGWVQAIAAVAVGAGVLGAAYFGLRLAVIGLPPASSPPGLLDWVAAAGLAGVSLRGATSSFGRSTIARGVVAAVLTLGLGAVVIPTAGATFLALSAASDHFSTRFLVLFLLLLICITLLTLRRSLLEVAGFATALARRGYLWRRLVVVESATGLPLTALNVATAAALLLLAALFITGATNLFVVLAAAAQWTVIALTCWRARDPSRLASPGVALAAVAACFAIAPLLRYPAAGLLALALVAAVVLVARRAPGKASPAS